MNKLFLLLLSLMFFSCNQNESQTEKNYIKNLEEKNKLLEKELQGVKNHSEKENKTESKNNAEPSKDYFTIGSTEDEVIRIMGEPSSYNSISSDLTILEFGASRVTFRNGKVESYSNIEDNLKVRVKK
jgi:hypothetical protein